MIWACFAASGPGQLGIIEGKMNSQVYQTILQDNVRMSVRQLKLCRGWVMQQDHDPKHRSKSTMEWLQKKQNPPFGVAKSDPKPQPNRDAMD